MKIGIQVLINGLRETNVLSQIGDLFKGYTLNMRAPSFPN